MKMTTNALTKDEGFSLVELIVTVVILGILAVVAIPIFGGIQEQAHQSAGQSIAANIATDVATQLAADRPAQLPDAASIQSPFEVDWKVTTPITVDQICVLVTRTDGGPEVSAGPGC